MSHPGRAAAKVCPTSRLDCRHPIDRNDRSDLILPARMAFNDSDYGHFHGFVIDSNEFDAGTVMPQLVPEFCSCFVVALINNEDCVERTILPKEIVHELASHDFGRVIAINDKRP